MRTSTRFYALFAAALLTLAGCDQRSISAPLQAAPGTMPAPAEPGQITVLQVTPLAGAGYAIGCSRDGNWCNMLLVVDVQLDQDVAEPWVTASFYNGSQRCGGTLSVRNSESIDPLRANTVTRFTTGLITLSAAQDGTFCTATTRMVVQLWGERGRSAAPLITREFAHNWTIFWSEKWED
jgi:hypothetical protein